MNIVKRSKMLPFYAVNDGEFIRMTGFTQASVNRSPIEYSRQYIDEEFKRNDVVGYDTAMSFSFDLFEDNAVHRDIANIAENEFVGGDAIREIVSVDLSSVDENGSCRAVKRSFSVMVENEGDSAEAYTYSGSFKASGEKVFGRAVSEDNWQTCTFTEGE